MNRRWLILLFGAACAAPRITHFRSEMGSCRAVDPNLIECGGRQMAQVECFQPGEEACGALAVKYADGERVFLSRPPGWDPTSQIPLEPNAVLRPEMSGDGSLIWFRNAGGRSDRWQVYEPNTGYMKDVDGFRIFQIREKERTSLPLWTAAAPLPPQQ